MLKPLDILKNYGHAAQMEKCVEECLELALALTHYRQGRVSADDVRSELADVSILLDQMALVFGVGSIEAEKRRKLDRTEERMREEN